MRDLHPDTSPAGPPVSAASLATIQMGTLDSVRVTGTQRFFPQFGISVTVNSLLLWFVFLARNTYAVSTQSES